MVQTSDKFAVWIAIGRIFSMLATFAMPLILTRYLPISDYGVFSQFFTLYTVLYAMFAFGIHTNLFFFYPNSEKGKQDIYVSNTLLALCVLGVISCILMCLPPVQKLFFSDSALSEFKYIVILCIALAVPINIISPLFSVREDKLNAVVLPAFVAISRILVIVVVAILFHDIYIIMIGMVVYQIVMTSIAIFYSLHGNKFHVNFGHFKEQLYYSLPFGIAVTLQLLSNYFDKIVSITLLSPTDYAIYSVAFLSIPGVNQLYDSLAQVNIINMSKCYKGNEHDKIVPLYKGFVQKTLSFSTPIIMVVALYAEEVIEFLFTKEYSGAAIYFRIYSLTFLIAMFGAGTILRSIGKTKYSMYAFAISCAIGLPMTYFLIKHYGVDGAILAAVINMVLPRLFQMCFEMKVMHEDLSNYLPWKKIFIIIFVSVGFLIPLVIVKYLYRPSIVLAIVLSVIYIVLTYSTYIHKDVFILDSTTIKSFCCKIKTCLSKKISSN